MRKNPKYPLRPDEKEALLEEHGRKCGRCGLPIDPVRDRWHTGHRIDRAIGGSDEWENLRPEHSRCNLGYAAEVGNGVAAKVKRVRQRHMGCREQSAWSKKYHATKQWLKEREKDDDV